MSVRAKFYVASVAETPYQKGSGNVTLKPVYKHGPGDHDNKAFFDATPSGEITLSLNARSGDPGELAFNFFKERMGNGDLYVTFSTLAEEGVVECSGGVYGVLPDGSWGQTSHSEDCPFNVAE